MGVTKTDQFTTHQNKVAAMAKAIAHPGRVAILEHLLEVNGCICKDLVEEVPLAHATISQHLKAMKAVGLIQGSIEGTSICYCLNLEAVEELANYFATLRDKIKSNNCC